MLQFGFGNPNGLRLCERNAEYLVLSNNYMFLVYLIVLINLEVFDSYHQQANGTASKKNGF